jgi:hypothetical protein
MSVQVPPPTTYDFIDQLKEAAIHEYSFRLMPSRWRGYQSQTELKWQRFLFDETTVELVPNEPGVYAFCVEPSAAANLAVCYLMYVGETTRPLKVRFREYLNEANNPQGRPQIVRLLNLFQQFLYFYCAPLDASISPEAVEEDLLNAFTPPTNTLLPAKVRRVEAAF